MSKLVPRTDLVACPRCAKYRNCRDIYCALCNNEHVVPPEVAAAFTLSDCDNSPDTPAIIDDIRRSLIGADKNE